MSTTPTSHGDDVVASRTELPLEAREPLLVLDRLEGFLDDAELGAGPISAQRIGDGHSNVTFAIRRGELRLVLRRPPRPPFHPSAHDVLREAGILRALQAQGISAPEVIATCSDAEVIGAPFFLMDHLDGLVVTAELPDVFDNPASRRALSDELVDALVAIHAADLSRPDLAALGRNPSRYLERQLDRFGSLWAEQRTREIEEVDEIGAWLTANRPQSHEVTLVHGDFRLGNVMYAPAAPPRAIAVLDWEMTTLGDPLADLGYMLAMWAEADDEPNPMLALGEATRRPGFCSRAMLRERYEAKSGRSAANLLWYEVLALWKSSIFLEGSYGRFLAGSTNDPYFAAMGEGVPALARTALRRIAAAGPNGTAAE